MTNEQSFAAQHGVLNYIHANAYVRPHNQPVHTAPTLDAMGPLTIAISRQAGIDAGAYARAIGDLLGWQIWDHELLELIATQLGSNVRELETLDERHISWIQESMEAFLYWHTTNQHTYVRHLREAMNELATLGNCVIVGRGAPHVLPPKTPLKVRLVAPLELRVAAFQRQMGITDAGQAARELEKLDRERIRFVKDHFHKDSVDPAGYDVVLNVAHISHADCARLVLDFLQAIEHPQVARCVPAR